MKKIWMAACLLLATGRLAAQNGPATADPVGAAMRQLRHTYDEAFPAHPQLLNGPEYIDYSRRYFSRTGHQYFLSADLQPGRVHYNGHDFQALQLRYDIVLDQVVLGNAANPLTFRLVNEKVRDFTLADHHFVRLAPDSSAGPALPTGYYELLADGAVQLLAKRAKRLQEQPDQARMNAVFIETDALFLRQATAYYPIRSKGQLLRRLPNHGRELTKFIQANKLKFRKQSREADFVALLRYYNRLAAQ